MKISSSQPDLRVTNGSASDSTSLLSHFDQRLDTIAPVQYTPAIAPLVEPHNTIGEDLTLCAPLSPGEELPPTAKQQQAAAIITRALRKNIAEKAYQRFFSLNPKYAGHYEPGQSATIHLQAQSRKHLAAVTQRLGALTPKEQAFFDKVAASPWAFQHTSDFNLEQNGHLKLYSSRRLEEEGKLIKSSTPPSDKDLVFLSVSFNAEPVRGALSKEKVIQYAYGNNLYVIQGDQALLEQGFMTLTDSMETQIGVSKWSDYPEHYKQQAAKAKNEMYRQMRFGDENPCYAFRDMKSAVALHAIEFLRQSKDTGFVKFVLEDADLAGADLDHILNTLFNCEFHLPRSVVTSHYSTFTLLRIKNEDEGVSAAVTAAMSQHDLMLLPSLEKQQLQRHITNYFSYPPSNFNLDSRENAEFLETLISQGLVDSRDPLLLTALIMNENLRLLEMMFKHGADETTLTPPERELLAKLRHAGASLQTIIMTTDSQALERYIGDDFGDMTKALAKVIETNATAMIDPLVAKWQLNADSLIKMMDDMKFRWTINGLTKPEHASTLDKLLSSGLIDPDKPLATYSGAPTLLQQAINGCNAKMVEILIRHGASVDKLPKGESQQYAFWRKHGTFLDNLIARTDLTALRKCLTDRESTMEILGHALARNNSEVVGMVLSACTENGWRIAAHDFAPADGALLDMKACVAFLNSGYAKFSWFDPLIPEALRGEALRAVHIPLASRFH